MSGLYIGNRSACERKVVYRTEAKAIRAASGVTWRGGNHPHVYHCSGCSRWHIVNTDPGALRR